MTRGTTGIRTPGRRVTCNPQPWVRYLNHSAIASQHWPMWWEFTGYRWISRTKGPVTRNMFPFDDVIMALIDYSASLDYKLIMLLCTYVPNKNKYLMQIISLRCVYSGNTWVIIDNETHESGVTKCTTGEAWSAFSWHHSSVSLSMNTQPCVPAFITHANLKYKKYIHLCNLKYVWFHLKVGNQFAVCIKWIDETWWNIQ